MSTHTHPIERQAAHSRNPLMNILHCPRWLVLLIALFLIAPQVTAKETKAFGTYSVTIKETTYGSGWSDSDVGKGTCKLTKTSATFSIVYKSGDRSKGTIYFEHALSPTAAKQSFSGISGSASDSVAIKGTITKTGKGWSISSKFIAREPGYFTSGTLKGTKK